MSRAVLFGGPPRQTENAADVARSVVGRGRVYRGYVREGYLAQPDRAEAGMAQ